MRIIHIFTAGVRMGTRRSFHAGSSRRQRSHSVGLGHRPSSRDSEEPEDTFTSTGIILMALMKGPDGSS